VVGTHRLLSKDVRWKDLGLIVIDEEQRFGVTHKGAAARAQRRRSTRSRSPPRPSRARSTWRSSGREISIIATPARRPPRHPHLRRALDDALLRDAIGRELARGGQVFFVHNRVDDIEEWSARVRDLVPSRASPIVTARWRRASSSA